jgi:hypothetical protein
MNQPERKLLTMARRFVTGLSPMKNKLQADWMSANERLKRLAKLADLWELPSGFYLAYCMHPANAFDVGMELISCRRVSSKLRIAGTVASNMIHEQVDRGLAAAAEMILNEIR